MLAILLIICAMFTGDKSSAQAVSVDDNYFFKSVNVDITVNKDKTFFITETLRTEFYKSGVNTGIIRDIQHISKTTRIVGGNTVQVLLPNGYFGHTVTFYWYYILFAVLALLGMLACVGLFLASRLKRKVLAPVEYLPPEDIGIMRFSAIWNRQTARHKGAI